MKAIFPLTWRLGLAVLLGALLGLAVRMAPAWRIPASSLKPLAEQPSPALPVARSSPPSRSAIASPAGLDRGAHTLAAFKSLGGSARYAPEELRTNVERMTTPDLRDLLARLDIDFYSRAGRSGTVVCESLIQVAIGELYRRESERSLQWARELGKPAGGGNSMVLDDLLLEAMRTDPPLAWRWIVDCRSELGPHRSRDLLGKVNDNATAVSAEALLEIESRMKQEKQEIRTTRYPATFAEDFDFERYFRETSASQNSSQAATYWAAKDPEAAYAALKDRLGENPSLFGLFCQGISSTQGTPAAAAWAASKLPELSSATRTEAVACLAWATFGRSPDSRHAHLATYMDALEGSPDQWLFASRTFQAGVSYDSRGPDLTAIERLGSEALQMRALAEQAEYMKRLDIPSAGQEWSGYQQAMDRLGFSASCRQKVREGFDKGAVPPVLE